VDHMENVTVQRIKSKACPKCKPLPEEFGSRVSHHCASDYVRYIRYEHKNLSLDSAMLKDIAQAHYPNKTHGIKKKQNGFSRTHESFDV